jgi:hypothetical protein
VHRATKEPGCDGRTSVEPIGYTCGPAVPIFDADHDSRRKPMPDVQAYWCFSHQAVEPADWAPHPDHLRVGPMSVTAAREWPDACPAWRGPVLELDSDPEPELQVG